MSYVISRLGIALAVMCLAYIVYLDITIRNRFEGQRWPIPAHVYTLSKSCRNWATAGLKTPGSREAMPWQTTPYK